jgi:hypothetical protein
LDANSRDPLAKRLVAAIELVAERAPVEVIECPWPEKLRAVLVERAIDERFPPLPNECQPLALPPAARDAIDAPARLPPLYAVLPR